MCSITLGMMALSMASTAAQVKSNNDSIDSQVENLNKQVTNEYAQRAYDTRATDENALDDGYVAEISKRGAVGRAKAKNASLGIAGTTADEMIADEVQVGNYNVSSMKEDRRQADTAYTVGTSGTYANAQMETMALEGQRASPFEALLGVASSGLSGYLGGAQAQQTLEGVPNKHKIA